MISQNDVSRLNNADVYDPNGDKIGSVGQVYLDTRSGEPEWVTVKTGLFGTKETFVPLQRASFTEDRLTVSYDKSTVKDAPRIDADGPLGYDEEGELYKYYGISGDSSYTDSTTTGSAYTDSSYTAATGEATTRGTTTTTGSTGTAGYTGSTGSSDNAMTRSEERLVAGTRAEETGRARLRKYVVTEQENVTVPVSREEVRLEREPITEANRGDAYSGADITEAEHEVTLRAERPVVDTETVPVERVRLDKETVREEQTVTGEVRKEQIEFDGPGRDRDRL